MIKNAHIFSAAKKRQRIKINSVRLRTGKIKKGNACDKKWKRETKDAFPKTPYQDSDRIWAILFGFGPLCLDLGHFA